MPDTDHKPRGAGGIDAGPSPAMWAVILTFVAVIIGNLLAEQTWVDPDWRQWWLPILGIEILTYAATLFIPPASRLTLSHGVLRILVGMAMRLVVVLMNSLMRVMTEGADFAESFGVFWAGHWAAAIGEIVCVAVAVYWFRCLALQRARAVGPKEALEASTELAGHSREELIEKLMADGDEGAPAAPEAPATVAGDAGPRPALDTPAVDQGAPPMPPAPPLPTLRRPEPVVEAAETPEDREPAPAPEPTPSAVAEREPPAEDAAVAIDEDTLAEEEPADAAIAEADIGPVRLPADLIVRALPASALSGPMEEIAAGIADREVAIDWAEIGPQLEVGEVRVPASNVLDQLPETVLSRAPERLAAELSKGIELPLEEIVMRLPPEAFAAPPDQKRGAELSDDTPIFHEAGAPTTPAPSFEPATQGEPTPPSPSEAPPADRVPRPPHLFRPPEPPPRPEAPIEEPVAAEPAPAPAEDEEKERDEEAAKAAAIAALQHPPPEKPEPAEAEPAEPEPIAEEAPEPEPVVTEPALEAEEEPEPAAEEALEPEPTVAEPTLEPEEPAPIEVQPAEPEPIAEEAPEPEPVVTEPAPEAEEEPEPTVAEPTLEPEEPEPIEVHPREAEPIAEEAPEPEPVVTEPALEAEEEPEPVAEKAVEPEPVVAGPLAEEQPAVVEGPTLDEDLQEAILTALKGIGCRRVELVARVGLTVVAADGGERGASAYDLAKSALRLAGEGGSGELTSALITGARGTIFAGGSQDAPGVYLVVAVEGASAGQVSVAARKAVSLLNRVPGDEAEVVPAPSPAAEQDEALGAVAAAAAAGAIGGFRAADGTGLMVFGLEKENAPSIAAAAAATWRVANEAQSGGLERILVMGPNRTIGVAMAGEVGALVTAGFEPGMNPGLAGTEMSKLVKACNQAAAAGGS